MNPALINKVVCRREIEGAAAEVDPSIDAEAGLEAETMACSDAYGKVKRSADESKEDHRHRLHEAARRRVGQFIPEAVQTIEARKEHQEAIEKFFRSALELVSPPIGLVSNLSNLAEGVNRFAGVADLFE